MFQSLAVSTTKILNYNASSINLPLFPVRTVAYLIAASICPTKRMYFPDEYLMFGAEVLSTIIYQQMFFKAKFYIALFSGIFDFLAFWISYPTVYTGDLIILLSLFIVIGPLLVFYSFILDSYMLSMIWLAIRVMCNVTAILNVIARGG